MPCRRSNSLRRNKQRLHTDSAPEKSGLLCKPKDAEGVRPARVNLSGKRTEIKDLGGFCFYAEFCI